MHLPSERIYKEIKSEAMHLWYVPANNGEDTAVLIKASSNTLKAITTGCKLELLFGIYQHSNIKVLFTGIRIYDTTDMPLLLFSVQRHDEEHLALKRILMLKQSSIFLFNELDMCVASGELAICNDGARKPLSLIGDIDEIYSGSFDNSFNYLLDNFYISIDPTIQKKPEIEISSISTPVSANNWNTHIVDFLGYHECNETTLNDSNEGNYFENKVWFSLDSIFKEKLYKSPQVKRGNKTRELTDILAYSNERLFMIEAKSISVIKAGFKRTQERKCKGVIKQVEKAIKQLLGAFNALEGYIFDNSSKSEIIIPCKKNPHCIVLVSELVEYSGWDKVVSKIKNLVSGDNYYIHVMDLREWIILLKLSSGDMRSLDASLKNRFNIFLETNSLHLRAIKSSK